MALAAAIDKDNHQLWKMWTMKRDALGMVSDLVLKPNDENAPNPIGWMADMFK